MLFVPSFDAIVPCHCDTASIVPGYPTARTSKPGRGVNGSSPRSHGTKDREALAEEVLELKKKIVRLTEEGSVTKAKTRRLEEDIKNKEKQIFTNSEIELLTFIF